MSITLRDALPNDEPFLFEVYASTRMQEMALVPWNDEQRKSFLTMQFAAQHAHYREQFPDANYSVILRDDLPLGRLYVLKEKGEIRILDITLLPEYRNSGIGSMLISELIDEARELNLPLRIYLENFNPSRGLFERLGFSQIGESGFNLLYERPPVD